MGTVRLATRPEEQMAKAHRLFRSFPFFSTTPSSSSCILLLLAFFCFHPFAQSLECKDGDKKSCCGENLGACGGCIDADLQECVCKLDKRCCNDVWDSLCVYHATRNCNANCPCSNSCSTASGYPAPPPSNAPSPMKASPSTDVLDVRIKRRGTVYASRYPSAARYPGDSTVSGLWMIRVLNSLSTQVLPKLLLSFLILGLELN